MRPMDVFHIGPQKSGTTWIYRCLREHPAIVASARDTVHYYDVNYAMGPLWYAAHFDVATADQLLFDPTYTYLRSPGAPRRMHADNPNAKIIVCLRDPIERAFSHYWHEKKKGKIAFSMAELLENYDLYSSWMEPGFYGEHLQRFLRFFAREQILCQRFETLQEDPAAFLGEIFEFLAIDPSFVPADLHRSINPAGRGNGWKDRLGGLAGRLARRVLPAKIYGGGPPSAWGARFSGKQEYVAGLDDELERRLAELIEPEIRRTEELLQWDLSSWRRP